MYLVPLALSSSWAPIISLFFYNIMASCTILLQDKNICTKYLLETIIKRYDFAYQLCTHIYVYSWISIMLSFVYMYLTSKIMVKAYVAMIFLKQDTIDASTQLHAHTVTSIYLTNTHAQNQMRTFKVWLAHLDIDNVMSYCLHINQAFGCSYGSFFNWLYTKKKITE